MTIELHCVPLRHVVIVSTIPGREHLLDRALASVRGQTATPDRVVVVPDGDAAFFESTARLARGVLSNAEVVQNRRTPGLAGAANSAIDHFARTEPAPGNVLVSFLDDDDHWDDGYLATVAVESSSSSTFLTAAIHRYDTDSPGGRRLALPSEVGVDDLLAGNPGIQGSSLSASLEALLLAGGFDESLSSCTDRDLAIRLLDLGLEYRPVVAAVVHHDTLHATPRLSDRGSESKRRGLDSFYAKYRWRMSPPVHDAFVERAERLFDWAVPSDPLAALVPKHSPPAVTDEVPTSVHLVVGVIVDGDRPNRAMPLMAGLKRLRRHESIVRLDVVLLENGSADGFDAVVARASVASGGVWPVRLADQAAAARDLALPPEDITRAKSIAVSRTLLQRFVHEVAQRRVGSIAWILDDDVRLPDDLGQVTRDIVRSRAAGHDVLIGGVSGAPPVPAAAILRTQLVDLAAFLHAAAARGPDGHVPAEIANARWRSERRDYYYDLSSSETDRLEVPFLPLLRAETFRDAVSELGGRVHRIFAGEAVTRPVVLPEGDVVADATPSCLRGGNALVFRIDLLRDIPNMSPRLDGRPVRRSDMIWAANAAHRDGRTVVAAPFALEQDRSADPPAAESPRPLIEDLVGYAFFRAYREETARHGPGVPLAPADRNLICQRTHKYAVERFAALRLSLWRARGLARVLARCVEGDDRLHPWWQHHPAIEETMQVWRRFVSALENRVSSGRLEMFEQEFERALRDTDFNGFLAEQERWLENRTVAARSIAIEAWFGNQRVERARERVRRQLGREADELLGTGSEGVVLRAGQSVLKVFDGWTESERADGVVRLRAFASSAHAPGLPEIIAVHDAVDTVIMETRYEASGPYSGGHGPTLARCLRALVRAGWVHTNVHPKNLRITEEGVQIVDLGRSLERATPPLVEAMCRRAFLSWRFWFRTDLDALMRQSNDSEDFCELTGWRGLLSAVTLSPKRRLDELVVRRVRELRPTRLLDYGCGKPRALHDVECEIAVFDPDPSLRIRWASRSADVTILAPCDLERLAIEGARFDVVVCALVLCTTSDDDAARVVADLRRLVASNGRVLVGMCDPTSVHIRHTAFQTRIDSAGIGYQEHGTYEKRPHGVPGTRRDVHRPLDAYRRMFARAGLRIEREESILGTDIDRFEHVGEFVLFELAPLPAVNGTTSLLVKVCPMESETAEHQVRHLVKSLGSPRGFDEVVVVVDPFNGPFPRQHRGGDEAGLRAALQRLLAQRVIDRVVDGPVDGDEARALADRWFGLSTTKAHCRNGQALLAMAKGIDACRGDFVLHADVDVLVGRPAPDHDHIAETIDLFREAPEAVSIALPVLGDDDRRPRYSDDRGPFRIETQVGWLHRQRLLSLLPLPNDLDGGALALPWHRALDRVVRAGVVESIRQGSPGIWFTSPDNARKANVDDHLLVLDRIEDGHAPDVQRGRAATSGSLAQWLGPRRPESMVIVACGRNVGPGRISRFRDALMAQSYDGWGAIVIDDASDDGTHESIHRAFADVRNRVTLIRRRRRVGALENLELAARRFIERPDAIVVLLDLDDALGRRDALAEIAAAHGAGADVTVGSMIRTDKQITYPVDFVEPRARRGGNVWQHVRAFRRSLFDRIEPADLRLQGARIDRATDWAYVLPIVEMADAPRWLRSPLYLHEPGTERTAQSRAVREPIIARLLARPRYSRGHRPSSVDHLTVVAHHRVVRDDASDPVTAIYRRRSMAVTATAFEAQIRTLLRRFDPVSLDEALAAAHGLRALPENALLLTFDDGYTDFAEVALPILERLGAPVALFARVPCDDGWPTWAPLDVIYLGLGRGGVAGNGHICPDAREKLLRLAIPEQHAVARACVALPDDELAAARRALYLSDRQIREVVTRGVGLGAHGVEHVRWSQLSRMTLEAELSASREWLQSLGIDAGALAYPDGAVNRATALAAERAGFVLALGLHERPVGVPTALAVGRWLAGIEEDWAERVPAGDEEKAS